MSSAALYLRALEPDDYLLINAWRQNEENYELTTGNRHFVSSERDRQWVMEKALLTDKDIYLAVCRVASNLLIGYLSLTNIDLRNSRAEWSGLVIGPQEYRGHGYATESVYLMLKYAFDELGLYRVSGSWLPSNAASIFVAKMLGFREEGTLRSFVYKNGKRHDVVIMSMLRPEFEQLKHRYA